MSKNIDRIYDGKCFYQVDTGTFIHDEGPDTTKSCKHSINNESIFIQNFVTNHQMEIINKKNELNVFLKEIDKWNQYITEKIESGSNTLQINCPSHWFRFLKILPSEHRKIYNLAYQYEDEKIFLIKRPFDHSVYNIVKYC